MAEFHFVEDYVNHVRTLMKNYPLDEAMSLAVGGGYEIIGNIQAALLSSFGLSDGQVVIDLGCGSGRTAKAISKNFQLDYLGTDVVNELLDYASTVCPPNYRFKLHRELSVPANTAAADLIYAFSLFTHLLHEETYIYLLDAMRVLKPGGKLVFSFLEFALPEHWHVFESTVSASRSRTGPHLNMFIERNIICTWADHIGFQVKEFIDGSTPIWNGHALGQSVVLLSKPN